MPAPRGNRNAVKAPDDLASVFLAIRVTRRDKAAWVRAAKGRGQTLSQWMRTALKDAAAADDPLTGAQK